MWYLKTGHRRSSHKYWSLFVSDFFRYYITSHTSWWICVHYNKSVLIGELNLFSVGNPVFPYHATTHIHQVYRLPIAKTLTIRVLCFFCCINFDIFVDFFCILSACLRHGRTLETSKQKKTPKNTHWIAVMRVVLLLLYTHLTFKSCFFGFYFDHCITVCWRRESWFHVNSNTILLAILSDWSFLILFVFYCITKNK